MIKVNVKDNWRTAIQSMLFLFCSLFPVMFIMSILHEGGHALAVLLGGGIIYRVYAHRSLFLVSLQENPLCLS